MNSYRSKLVVLGVAALSLAPFLLLSEYKYGFVQKLRFELRAERHLAATYSEAMAVERVRYLPDNIMPLVATAHPESDPSLEFSVYPNDLSESGLSDDYVPTLWNRQALQEAAALLTPVRSEYARRARVEFVCCDAAALDVAAIRGDVPPFETAGIPVELTVEFDRPMAAADPELMYRAAKALQSSDALALERLVFRFPMKESVGTAVFAIPGGAVASIASANDLELYNLSSMPARRLAERIGATLHWNEATHEAVFTRGDTTLVVREWEEEALLNGEAIDNPTPADIGDTLELMVSVRLIERAFGEKIELQ